MPVGSRMQKGLANKAVSLQEGCEQRALLVWAGPVAHSRSGRAEASQSQCSNQVIHMQEGPHNLPFFFLPLKL